MNTSDRDPVEFHFERLDVYRVAIEFAADADVLANALLAHAQARGHLADQLRRVSTSIVLNIAEGAGEWKAAEKARFYRMALRSATECTAIVALIERLNGDRHDERRRMLHRVVSMLSRLVEAKPRRPEPNPRR